MYTLQEQKRCSVNITSNKNRIKQYENSVYLKDGQQFELEIFNPHQCKVLAKISINGKAISQAGLVIRPGQRTYLERYIDIAKKFKFETYEVEDSAEAKEAIAKNGEVKVEFYYEQNLRGNYWYGNSMTINSNNWNGSHTTTINPNTFFTTTGTSTSQLGSGISYTSNTSGTISYGGTTVNNISMPVAGSLETGRVEEGSKSKQQFSQDSGTYNYWVNETVIIKLLPLSKKPVEVAEIRNYCGGCGSRIKKSSWKFCPSCGESLD
jgi:hypothetical protein